jgi:hypothetical protein
MIQSTSDIGIKRISLDSVNFMYNARTPLALGALMATKVDLAVIVNGQPTVVSANPQAALESVISKALEQTGNVGQPPGNWEIRDSAGTELDPHRKINDFQFAPGAKLFLNLKAGVGG